MFAEGCAYFLASWLELSTMGSLGQYLVQPRREIPIAVRGEQDGGQAGGCGPGFFLNPEISRGDVERGGLGGWIR